MNIVTAVIVYNRYENVERWIECWNKSDKVGDFIIVHNIDEPREVFKYAELCDKNNVRYVARKNIGYDIGALKQVIEGLVFFDYLLWCTDDTIPMRRDFVNVMYQAAQQTGVSCMEISKEVTPHIRTTGFMISKEVAQKLVFPNPLLTKEDCYHFEHRGGKMIMFQQLRRLGASPIQVTHLNVSPFWDIGNKRHLRMNRWAEFEDVWIEKLRGKGYEGKIIVPIPKFVIL